MGLMSKAKFKNVDFYRKIPKDMTEGTISGSVISMLAAAVIGLLLISEIGSYLTPKFDTRVVIDRSADGEMMACLSGTVACRRAARTNSSA